jgi:uncharacterized membrane-anchored protein
MSKLYWPAAFTAATLAFTVAPSGAFAQNSQTAEDAEAKRLDGVLRSQHRLDGDVSVPGTNATLHLGKKYYFLRADEAKQVLTEWGNPPSATEGVLGIVFPAGKTFLDDGWGSVVTYEPAGHIDDSDSEKADYQKLLEDAQQGEDAENAERKKAGFSSTHLVGWAQPPVYDKAHHYIIWARDIRFGDQDIDTLNYDVRVLGRQGYLSLNLISAMSELPSIRTDAAQLAAAARFDPGSAYADFKPGTDRAAGYGLAGLVAAGVGVVAAKKIGLLAVIALFAKKLIIVFAAAGAAIAARFKRLFKRGPDTSA